MRFRELGYNQMLAFEAATTHGLPLVGFRTSTHAFRYPGDDDGAKRWNDAFPIETWGTNWKFHHGHSSKTRILPPDAEAAKHPVLAGVTIPKEGIVVRSWLYHVEPLPADCRVLLWGEAVDSERPDAPQKQPILWVREKPRKAELPLQRIAFTTLGHPADFTNPSSARQVAATAGSGASSGARPTTTSRPERASDFTRGPNTANSVLRSSGLAKAVASTSSARRCEGSIRLKRASGRTAGAGISRSRRRSWRGSRSA
jgi:hypothetical protein